jgi:HlyD family secretion protein
MRTFIVLSIVAVVLGTAAAAGYKPAMEYLQKQNAPRWKTAAVARGEIISVVNATGTIKPILQIAVGAFVSGPIDAEFQITDHQGNKLVSKNGEKKHIVEFNEEVKKGDMLAKVQDRIYLANRDRDKANLASREADLTRVQALLWQAKRDEWRALELRDKNDKFIAQAETDKAQFARISLEAQEKLAAAAVKQAAAQLEFSQAQLDYCDILAPVDGIIINRKIDPGQTLAAQFQTPELFVIGPKMRERMHVHASVDEADIGLIKKAQIERRPVSFTVDAYPDMLFDDEVFKDIDAEFKRVQIAEVRMSSTTTQNVVTYPVVVETPNPNLDLMPGMTAAISFEVDRRTDVLKIPNSALRYYPQVQHVRPQDKPLLEGRQDAEKADEELPDSGLAAKERADARKKRSRRHVWVQDGYKLRAVEVETGISDSYFTEMVSGDLKSGDALVIGIQPAVAAWGQ